MNIVFKTARYGTDYVMNLIYIYFRKNTMPQTFEILKEDRKEYRSFNVVGIQLTVRLHPSSETDTNHTSHFIARVNDFLSVRSDSHANGIHHYGRH